MTDKPQSADPGLAQAIAEKRTMRKPAKVRRTGVRQLSVSLSESDCKMLKRIRRRYTLRSWGEAIRVLIRSQRGWGG